MPALPGVCPESRNRWRFKLLVGFAIVLSAAFIKPLSDLIRYALEEDLYSHVLLVPFISGYLIWTASRIPVEMRPSPKLAAVTALLGIVLVTLFWVAGWRGVELDLNDSLPLTILSFLCLGFAGAFAIVGKEVIHVHAFACAFLLFMVPLPNTVAHWITVFFQYTSADLSYFVLKLSNTPVFRQDLTFQLPGLWIRVAEECSGIRSSLVLVLTGLLAGKMFLRAAWKRVLLVLIVIPIAIARNALRIVTLALLTVHVDPGVIDSPLHHRGGPIFFLLSLIPFFLVLWLLRRGESVETRN